MRLMSCQNENTVASKKQAHAINIADKAHKHAFRQATFTNIKTSVKYRKMWNKAVEKYIYTLLKRFVSCSATSPPQPKRKFSTTFLSQGLYGTVCASYIFLEIINILHAIYFTSLCSAACVVSNIFLNSTVVELNSCWIRRCFLPMSIRANKNLFDGIFKAECDEHSKKLSPDPSNKHNKLVMKSKHDMTR